VYAAAALAEIACSATTSASRGVHAAAHSSVFSVFATCLQIGTCVGVGEMRW
jgi:hypothetical protein